LRERCKKKEERERGWERDRERETKIKCRRNLLHSEYLILLLVYCVTLAIQICSEKEKIIISVMLNGLSRRYVKNLRYSKVVFNIYFKPLTYLNLLPQSNIKKNILFPLTFKF
jgi:hypothetical protein